MTTVLFVHGTGVRKDDYQESLEVVTKELKTLRPNINVESCLWGDTLGAKLSEKVLSVPNYDSTLSVGDPARPEDYQRALWGMLYQDPLYELQVLALAGRTTNGAIGQDDPPGELLDAQVRRFQPTAALQARLADAGLANTFEAARQAVVDSDAYRDALQSAAEDLAPYRAAVARAIIAQAIMLARIQDRYPAVLMDADLRDQLVNQIADALGDPDLSISGWVGKQIFRLAQKLGAMDQVQRRRGALTNAAYPFAGDVLLYQARGEPIRDFIRAKIEQAAPPVVVIAHSLGGIACVDLFALPNPPQVELLVTVGSQAPFLYEIGALHSLGPGEKLPASFPKAWLNIYDLGDFLSYIGAGVFPDRVEDLLVDNKQPFPESHSAYWGNQTMWQAIGKRLP